jgi:hypothetical protein
MFTPDWADVLSYLGMLLHDQTCFPVWKLVEKDLFLGMETATCFLLEELVEWFILLFCNLGLHDTRKGTKLEINLRRFMSLTASMNHFPSSSILDLSSQ